MGCRLRNFSLRCLSQNSIRQLYLRLLITLSDASIEKGAIFPKTRRYPMVMEGRGWLK